MIDDCIVYCCVWQVFEYCYLDYGCYIVGVCVDYCEFENCVGVWMYECFYEFVCVVVGVCLWYGSYWQFCDFDVDLLGICVCFV